MPRRLGTTFGLCASAGALAALVLTAPVPGSGAASRASSPAVAVSAAAPSGGPSASTVAFVSPKQAKTKTPIKHVVVIFDENISYDHYFGTYPEAKNKGGGTKFKAKKDTPKNDNLITSKKLKKNPNLYKPFRLAPSEALTCARTTRTQPSRRPTTSAPWTGSSRRSASTPARGLFGAPGSPWATTTATRSPACGTTPRTSRCRDRHFSNNFGPSTPGALNLVVRQHPRLPRGGLRDGGTGRRQRTA